MPPSTHSLAWRDDLHLPLPELVARASPLTLTPAQVLCKGRSVPRKGISGAVGVPVESIYTEFEYLKQQYEGGAILKGGGWFDLFRPYRYYDFSDMYDYEEYKEFERSRSFDRNTKALLKLWLLRKALDLHLGREVADDEEIPITEWLAAAERMEDLTPSTITSANPQYDAIFRVDAATLVGLHPEAASIMEELTARSCQRVRELVPGFSGSSLKDAVDALLRHLWFTSEEYQKHMADLGGESPLETSLKRAFWVFLVGCPIALVALGCLAAAACAAGAFASLEVARDRSRQRVRRAESAKRSFWEEGAPKSSLYLQKDVQRTADFHALCGITTLA